MEEEKQIQVLKLLSEKYGWNLTDSLTERGEKLVKDTLSALVEIEKIPVPKLTGNRFLFCLKNGKWKWKWQKTKISIGYDFSLMGNYYEMLFLYLLFWRVEIYTPFRNTEDDE